MDLEGRVAVVTGGASGIGRALADAFAGAGMRLVLADIEEPALDAAVEALASAGADVLAVPTDVSDPDAVEALARATEAHFGAAHVVCNNAGVGGVGGDTWTLPVSAWAWVLDVNLWGVIHGVRTFVPRLVAQGEGHVVNTASLAAFACLPGMGPYCVAKHGVFAISDTLRAELAARGANVGVTVACPDFLRTNLASSTRNWPARYDAEPEIDEEFIVALDALIDSSPGPEEVAARVVTAVRDNNFLVTTDTDLTKAAIEARVATMRGEATPPTSLG